MAARRKRTVFTIGYEGADVDRFLTTLNDAGVATVADVRAVALSRKKGFSKNQLRDNLAEAEIGYRHFIDLGTPKAGREAARAGDTGRMHRIFCEQLATGAAQAQLEELTELAGGRSRSAFSASSATPPSAIAASSPSGSRSVALRRWICS